MLIKTSIHSVARPLPEGGLDAERNGYAKGKLNSALSSILESTYGLYQECLYYYWTVAGDECVGLDKVFEKQYESLQCIGKQIHERLCVLTYQKPTAQAADHLHLPSFPHNRMAVTSVRKMLDNVIKGHEACSKQVLSALKIAETLDDQKTVTLLLQAMLLHDKASWMLKALRS